MNKQVEKVFQFVLILFSLSIFSLSGQESETSYRSVNLGEIREVKSIVNDKDYELIINYPPSYRSDTTRNYPVVYFCDGYYDFPLLTMIFNNLNYDQQINECFLVGFSYKGENIDYGPLRMHDYMPTKSGQNNTGGGAKEFLAVVEKDFIPYMEKNFRVDPSWRALGGSSAGGMFCLYSLFTKPELFNAYMAISPAAGWDNRWLFEYEEKFSKANKSLPVSLYMTGGEKEFPWNSDFIKSIIEFDEVLKSRKYSEFRYKFRVLENTYHASSKPEGYNRGMQFIFEPLLNR